MTDTLMRSRFGPVTLHAPRRRRRRRRIVGALLLAVAATIGGFHYLADGSHRDYLSTDGWPRVGQGAYRLGDGPEAVSPDQRPVPIASLAKVMTAVLVLRHLPLESGSDGPSIVVTPGDVADTDRRRRRGESLVAVRAGERLSERQALMAVLLPSANNVAVMLARRASGSVGAFVAEMNEAARALGMRETTYTDPSGFDAGTVSTAADQLKLAEFASRDRLLAAMMATRSYDLPVAGTVRNTDALLGRDGFVGMKTGSDDAAGGCFMFHVLRRTAQRRVELIGVVLGQHGGDLVTAGLDAAEQLADRLA
jgi:D-alanyl-D-alanine carboxypeptidase (penicillin-binding protein 5/6)